MFSHGNILNFIKIILWHGESPFILTSLSARPIWPAENFTDLVIHPAQDVTVIFGESREFFFNFSVDLERYIAKLMLTALHHDDKIDLITSSCFFFFCQSTKTFMIK